jgi:hypothetical protein
LLAVTTVDPVHGPLLLNGEPAGAEPDDPLLVGKGAVVVAKNADGSPVGVTVLGCILALSKDGPALRPDAAGGCAVGCADGNSEGVGDGIWEGVRLVGIEVGIEVGVLVGKLDGVCEGSPVGTTVGTDVGFLDGRTVVGPGVARLAAVAASVETPVTL